MRKFTFISESNSNKTSLEYTPVYGTPSLPDIVDQFKKFLLGCGYEVNGELEIIEDYKKPVQLDLQPLGIDSFC